jgi:hypothetical protein
MALLFMPAGCTYSPHIVFSNPTSSQLEVKLALSKPNVIACSKPDLAFLPSDQAWRRWRTRDIRDVDPGFVSFFPEDCQLVVSVPPKTALDIKFSEYFGWGETREEDLVAIASVTLSGELGSVSVSGRLALQEFTSSGIGSYVWEYGRS